ncbi:MATE family efflux transporter [Bacteroidia bacterium]|nr:MATE family efflux transporter [Bacteroidia bacterium]
MKKPFAISELKQRAIKLSIPMVLGQLGLMLQGVTDVIMVGPLGDDYISSANMANNVFFLLIAFFMGMLFSMSTVISIKDGEGKRNNTPFTYKAGLLLSFTAAILIVLLNEITIANFSILGQVSEINDIAPGYLRIIGWSAIPFLVFVAARQFSDGLGITAVGMYISIGGFIVNILFNGIGINGWITGVPLGITGAGLATLSTRVLMAIGLIIYIAKHKTLGNLKSTKVFNWEVCKKESIQLIKLGIPLGVQFFAEVACFAVSGLIVGTISSVQAAAHAVALSIAALTYMAVTGVAQAGGILAGNFYGERNLGKLKILGKDMIQLSVIFQLFFGILLFVFKRPIALLFELEGETLELTVLLLTIACVFQLADGIQVIAMNLLRGIKDVKMSMTIALVSYWIIPIPFSYYFGVVMGYGAQAVWWGFVIGLTVACILGVVRYFWKINQGEHKIFGKDLIPH